MSDPVSLCASIEPLLGDYADGEVVSAADKARIETHLKSCASCASDLAFFRATNFVISSSFADVQPPVDLFVRTARATYARPSLRSRVAGWLAPTSVRVGLGSALAAAVVLAVVVPVAQRQSGNSGRSLAQNEPTGVPPSERANSEAVRSNGAELSNPGNGAKIPEARHETKLASVPHTNPLQNERESHVPPVPASVTPATEAPFHSASPAVALVSTAPVSSSISQDLPTIIHRVKSAPLVVPVRRDLDELARRGGLAERTLPNGDLPREFVAPTLTVPIVETETPKHDTAVAVSVGPGSGGDLSPAHIVVEPPPAPKSLHINLGGAGTGAPAAGSLATKIASSTVDTPNRNFPGFVDSRF